MTEFTAKDLSRAETEYPTLYADRSDLVECPLWWHKQGLQQTAIGYGRKLTMSSKIHYEGRLYRLYCTCYSNAGSVWFTCKGRRIYVLCCG